MSATPFDQAQTPTVILTASHPLFRLGHLVATPGALELLARYGVEPAILLSRHVSGDWGQLPGDDARANNDAVKYGDRILSAYVLPLSSAVLRDVPAEDLASRDRVWIITEADRSSTCVLLPSEY